jgi:hypothetical protein
MQVATKKTKSPTAPSYPLRESFGDSRRLYRAFGHAQFSKTEIASALGLSSTSSSLGKRVFALTEYGLLEDVAGRYKVSSSFHVLDGNASTSADFRRVAYSALERPAVFAALLAEFPTKLPDRTVLTQRLEREKGFNSERAREIATIFEKSLQFAGVLDANNNIVPIRDDETVPATGSSEIAADEGKTDRASQEARFVAPSSLWKTEVPLPNNRTAVVFYPPDLEAIEAQKIGKVLAALVE